MGSGKERARHMLPPITSGRLDRQWAGVQALTERSMIRRRQLVGLSAAVACCVVLGAAAMRLWPTAVVRESGLVETSGTAQVLTLVDGSRVEVAESSRFELAEVRTDAIHIVLQAGKLSLDVVHDEARAFTVSSAGFDVIVRGTRFSIDRSPTELTVSVQEGRVEARRAGSSEAVRSISAGESWSRRLDAAESAQPEPAASHPAIATPDKQAPGRHAANDAPERPSPKAAPSSELRPDSTARDDATAPGADTKKDALSALVQAGKYREAYASLGPSGFARELAHADARRLFELADAARLGGHPRDAALALDKLRRTHRSDSRAGLAALALGRLRMDTFGDTRGALEAFRDATTLVGSGSVREDAQSRIVMALDALGDRGGCAKAREAYLERFPKGIHAATIRTRCGAQ